MLSVGMRARSGATLIELVVTLVIAGVALALIAGISIRQQRVVSDLTDAAATESQIGDALSVLSAGLAGVSSGAGDIREARDTALEIRTTVASAVACDTAAGRVVLSPPSGGASAYASIATPIESGDTAWILSPTDTAETWRPFRVASVSSAPAGDCAATGPRLDAAARSSARSAVGLDGFSVAHLGMPIRFTRPARYSVYRGSDGQWYLGFREWDYATARFNGIQPVAGPFASPASNGLVFQFADTTARTIAAPVADTRAIALLRIDARADTRRPVRELSTRGVRRREEAGEWILLRNRR
jgi:hypothetical protein